MRMLPLIYPAALILASACEQAPSLAPAVNSPDGATPTFGTSNGPENPGNSFVFRSGGFLFLVTEYPDQDLIVRHYNAEDIDFCGGSTASPEWEFQDVVTPRAVVDLAKSGTIPAYVYRISEVPSVIDVTPEFCSDLKSKWIYRGTHHILNHDNDVFGDPTRTNPFGFHAEGTLFDRAGGKHAYRELFFAVFDPRTGQVHHERLLLSIK